MDFITTNELVASTPLWASIVGQILIVGGALLFTTSAIGLVRLPDMYTRASAIATAAGFGVALMAAGSFFFVIGVDTAIKIALAIVLQLITSAVGSMTLARAAYLTGSAVYSPTHTDQLAESIREEPGWQHIEPMWRPDEPGVNPARVVGQAEVNGDLEPGPPDTPSTSDSADSSGPSGSSGSSASSDPSGR